MEVLKATDRLNYSGALDPIIERLCSAYEVGIPNRFSLVEVGYEDCNVVIETEKGKYLAKMFSKERSKQDIDRYTKIMEKVVEAGVNHPELITTTDGSTVYQDSGITLILMRFIEGSTFFELNRTPDDEERRLVIEQAAKVNNINHKPPYLFDSWAIPNIKTMLDRVREFMKPDDLALVEQVIAQYDGIPVSDLPHTFVHGDFTKANVLKGNDGKIYILDFSVANWYPRIQELAVIAANLLHDEVGTTLRDRCDIAADEYSRFNPLTEEERRFLYPYALAGVAMELIGAHKERYINGNDSEETQYWFNLGREGLRQALGSPQ